MGDITVFDKLLEWYTSPKDRKSETPLSEDELKALARWECIDDLYRRHRPALRDRDIKNMVMERFTISERQYFYDKHNAQRFFGTFNKTDKEYMINVQVEYYKQIRSLAEADGDYMSAIRASENIDKLLGLFEKDVEGAELMPTSFQIILNLRSESGDKTKTINIDKLQKLPEEEFQQTIDAANQLTMTPEAMEQMLTKKPNE